MFTTIVLGIDPGTAIVGYGLVRSQGGRLTCLDYGCIRTSASQDTAERLHALYKGVLEVIKRGNPDVVAVEQIFFSKNAKTAFAVGQARGVAILAASSEGIRVAEYTPLQVKSAVTGYGRAEKVQVQNMVQRILFLPTIPRPDDAADALAIAICCTNSIQLEDRIARSYGKTSIPTSGEKML